MDLQNFGSELKAVGLSVRPFERRLVDCLYWDYTETSWNATLTLMVMPSTLLLNNQYYYFVYHVVLQFLMGTGGPFMLIVYYGLSIVHAVDQRPKILLTSGETANIRKNVSAQLRDIRSQRHISQMMLLTAAKFLCSRALPLFLNLTNVLSWTYDWYELVSALSNLLVVLHSATNWLFYKPKRHQSTTLSATNCTMSAPALRGHETMDGCRRINSVDDNDLVQERARFLSLTKCKELIQKAILHQSPDPTESSL